MFGFLIFITIVIYGMWVAQGVVAEKASRVMELLISAASTRQLVIGKALGIGLAGATQTTIVLAPALLVLAAEDGIARLILGQGVGFASSLTSLSPGLLLAFAVFYVLGFALYALIYAAAGSLVSRPEDLQIIALPLSIVAIAGYGMGLLALTGGITELHPARLVRPVLEPVRDADAAVGRAGRAVGAGAVGLAARRDDPRHERDRDPDLRRGRAALRAAARVARVRGGGAGAVAPDRVPVTPALRPR